MARNPTGMHPEDIRAEIKKKFGSLAAMSRHFKRHSNAIANTICQPGYSVPLEAEIAKVIERDVRDIWPARYHPDGSPRRVRDVRTPTRCTASNLRANGAAA